MKKLVLLSLLFTCKPLFSMEAQEDLVPLLESQESENKPPTLILYSRDLGSIHIQKEQPKFPMHSNKKSEPSFLYDFVVVKKDETSVKIKANALKGRATPSHSELIHFDLVLKKYSNHGIIQKYGALTQEQKNFVASEEQEIKRYLIDHHPSIKSLNHATASNGNCFSPAPRMSLSDDKRFFAFVKPSGKIMLVDLCTYNRMKINPDTPTSTVSFLPTTNYVLTNFHLLNLKKCFEIFDALREPKTHAQDALLATLLQVKEKRNNQSAFSKLLFNKRLVLYNTTDQNQPNTTQTFESLDLSLQNFFKKYTVQE